MQKIIFRFIYLQNYIFWRRLRNYYYKNIFSYFGKKSNIFGKITVYYPEKIFFGDGSSINDRVELNARGGIEIGNNVHISSGTIIHTGRLDYKKTGEDRKHDTSTVVLEDGVWVGSGAIVLPGIKIGKNSVIGAGSVVTKNVPEGEVWVGIPAKFLKKIHE